MFKKSIYFICIISIISCIVSCDREPLIDKIRKPLIIKESFCVRPHAESSPYHTGIEVEIGDRIVIEASGTVISDDYGTTGPTGHSERSSSTDWLTEWHHIQSLVFFVDADKNTGYEPGYELEVNAHVSGELIFGIWLGDSDYKKASGGYDVTIEVYTE